MEEVFKKAYMSEGIDVNREHLTNLWFADDVALFNNNNNNNNNNNSNNNNKINDKWEKTFKQSKLRKSETRPKNTQGKDKTHDKLRTQWRYTNWTRKNEKATQFKYLGQTTHLKETTTEETDAKIRAEWSCFGKKKGAGGGGGCFKIDNSPYYSKNK